MGKQIGGWLKALNPSSKSVEEISDKLQVIYDKLQVSKILINLGPYSQSNLCTTLDL